LGGERPAKRGDQKRGDQKEETIEETRSHHILPAQAGDARTEQLALPNNNNSFAL
jgi:hypothetical protein